MTMSGVTEGGTMYLSLSHWGLWLWIGPFGFEEPKSSALPYRGEPLD